MSRSYRVEAGTACAGTGREQFGDDGDERRTQLGVVAGSSPVMPLPKVRSAVSV